MGDLFYKGDIWVGNDVWIGYDVIIMFGVIIGNGVIVVFKLVVIKDVLVYVVVVGNFVKVLKMCFDDVMIVRLESLCWWDWLIEIIIEVLLVIISGNIDVLLVIGNWWF